MLTGNQKIRLGYMTLWMRALQFLSTSLIISQFQKALISQKILFPFWLKWHEHLPERLVPTKTGFNIGGKDNLGLYCSGSAQLLSYSPKLYV